MEYHHCRRLHHHQRWNNHSVAPDVLNERRHCYHCWSHCPWNWNCSCRVLEVPQKRCCHFHHQSHPLCQCRPDFIVPEVPKERSWSCHLQSRNGFIPHQATNKLPCLHCQVLRSLKTRTKSFVNANAASLLCFVEPVAPNLSASIEAQGPPAAS